MKKILSIILIAGLLISSVSISALAFQPNEHKNKKNVEHKNLLLHRERARLKKTDGLQIKSNRYMGI